MAKGLRSKSMRRNRAHLRTMVFGPAEKARMERLKEAAVASVAEQKKEETAMTDAPSTTATTEATTEERGRISTGAAAADSTKMEVDGASGASTAEGTPMTKQEKMKLFMSRNAYRKKMIAKARSDAKKQMKLKRR
ncbi:uncharacterized protein EV422DRAFT_354153 [Fimicolochytrium jonesii]|uniref:uncharacterized protein n=1 Tax=Fimicolochytrium jonesii TaxID=1396493 RepID=UPI0022FE244E|nr:uncharacterized protein EV422DRAFT_354153 [Fimicolochytrium jonesii]KAI8823419.1 hypothetical protein EV422DRAFT_354153 [Fimicolochytrium jonesii]